MLTHLLLAASLAFRSEPSCGVSTAVAAAEARRSPRVRVLPSGPGEARVRVLLSQLVGDLNTRATNELAVRYGAAPLGGEFDRLVNSLPELRQRQGAQLRITDWGVESVQGEYAGIAFRLLVTWTNAVGAERASLFDGVATAAREDGGWQLASVRLSCSRR